ncbi:olfactory receptor 13C2-like [Halichoeres trimaculatus]|uniref:olfactory receptor 13C2-like n=1 Tax=Halichoeres trimaculatus TaxID=147232 RepID=UPI003D9EA547
MDKEHNVTPITLGGYVEMEKYRYVYFGIIFTVYILIICCNSTIVCLIVKHQNLHEPMYILIAALLINTVLYSTTTYPKLLVDFLSEKQVISHSMCHFQFFIFYSLGASEFLLLSVMAYDRYVSICKPLQYPTIMKKKTIILCLLLAWFLPACQMAGSSIFSSAREICNYTLKGIFCNNSIYKLYCKSSSALNLYGLVGFLNLAVYPMVFIIFTYSKILIISYRSCKEVRSKATQTCLPHLLVLINFTLLVAYDVSIVRLESYIPKTARLIMTLQLVLYHPLFNPIIYGLKMKEIYKHLKRLFCQVKLSFVLHLLSDIRSPISPLLRFLKISKNYACNPCQLTSSHLIFHRLSGSGLRRQDTILPKVFAHLP